MQVKLGRNRRPDPQRPRKTGAADAAIIDLLGSGVVEDFLAGLAARFNGTPFADVEDALFEAIADAWRRMQDRSIDDLRAYVYRAAFYRLARNAKRRSQLGPLVEAADGPLLEAHIVVPPFGISIPFWS